MVIFYLTKVTLVNLDGKDWIHMQGQTWTKAGGSVSRQKMCKYRIAAQVLHVLLDQGLTEWDFTSTV